jgi:hypothetical protein
LLENSFADPKPTSYCFILALALSFGVIESRLVGYVAALALCLWLPWGMIFELFIALVTIPWVWFILSISLKCKTQSYHLICQCESLHSRMQKPLFAFWDRLYQLLTIIFRLVTSKLIFIKWND